MLTSLTTLIPLVRGHIIFICASSINTQDSRTTTQSGPVTSWKKYMETLLADNKKNRRASSVADCIPGFHPGVSSISLELFVIENIAGQDPMFRPAGFTPPFESAASELRLLRCRP